MKDLIRFLRYDNDCCDIRRQLGEAEIVSRDLLPIIKQYHDDRILFDTVIRLAVISVVVWCTCLFTTSIMVQEAEMLDLDFGASIRHCHFAHNSGCEILMSASVCLCVCLSISPEPHGAIFTKFFVCVAYGCGSVLHGSVLPRHVDDRPHRLSSGRDFLPH